MPSTSILALFVVLMFIIRDSAKCLCHAPRIEGGCQWGVVAGFCARSLTPIWMSWQGCGTAVRTADLYVFISGILIRFLRGEM